LSAGRKTVPYRNITIDGKRYEDQGMSPAQHFTFLNNRSACMKTLDDLLAKSPWALELPRDTLQRVRGAIVVRDLTPGCYVCHKGDARASGSA
jgi:hypothetical protein